MQVRADSDVGPYGYTLTAKLLKRSHYQELVKILKGLMLDGQTKFDSSTYVVSFSHPNFSKLFISVIRNLGQVFGQDKIVLLDIKGEGQAGFELKMGFNTQGQSFNRAMVRYALALAEHELSSQAGRDVTLDYNINSEELKREAAIENVVKRLSQDKPLTLNELAEAAFVLLRREAEARSKRPTPDTRRWAFRLLLSPEPDFTTKEGRIEAIKIAIGPMDHDVALTMEERAGNVVQEIYMDSVMSAIQAILPFNPSRKTVLSSMLETLQTDPSCPLRKGGVKELRGSHIDKFLVLLEQDVVNRLANLLKAMYLTCPSNSLLSKFLEQRANQVADGFIKRQPLMESRRDRLKLNDATWKIIANGLLPRISPIDQDILRTRLFDELDRAGYMRKI
jgi:hypothetical protein